MVRSKLGYKGFLLCSTLRNTRKTTEPTTSTMFKSNYNKREIMKIQGLINWISSTNYSAKPLMSVTRKELVRIKKLSLDHKYTHPMFFKMSLIAMKNNPSFLLKLGIPDQYLNIMTDASKEGWGIKFPHLQLAGKFDKSMIPKDIALKELIVIFWALLLVTESRTSIRIHTISLESVQVLKKGYSKVLS